MSEQPSFEHLERHQRDLDAYRSNVRNSAEVRFGPGWWGPWDQYVDLPEGGHIVDLGCGPGTLLGRLRARNPEARLTGVELHPALLEEAQQHLADAQVSLIQGDLAVPVVIPDASVDVVVSSLSFHELPHPPHLLENAARILAPGGTFVLFDIVKWPLATYMQGKELTQDTLDHYREHCLFSAEDLAWLVQAHGLEVQEVFTRHSGRFAYLFAQKPA